MMTDTVPNWERLNAFVDGELAPQDAAEVARAAEEDADLAEQISLLYQLKGSIGAALPSAPPELAARLEAAPPAPTFRRPVRLAASASLVLAGLAAVWIVWSPQDTPQGSHDLLSDARQFHDDWLRHDVSGSLVEMPAVLDTLTSFGRLAVVPDLESAGLSVGLATVSYTDEGRILQIGYRGHHGCHLSLFVATGAALPEVTLANGSRTERAHAWQVSDLTYLMLAEGMDPARFNVIADKVERASRGYFPLDQEDKRQLAENTRASASCRA